MHPWMHYLVLVLQSGSDSELDDNRKKHFKINATPSATAVFSPSHSKDVFHRVDVSQLAQDNNKTLAAAIHPGDPGQALKEWVDLNHRDRTTFRRRERGLLLRVV